MVLYRTFLTVRQENTIKCPKNCVFWNLFLHQKPGFPGFLCIFGSIFAPLRGVFAPFGGIFPHSFARRQDFPNTKFAQLQHIPCICLGGIFLRSGTGTGIAICDLRRVLYAKSIGYRERVSGSGSGMGMGMGSGIGIICKISVQVFPRSPIHEGGLPPPNF